jgi:hypothetical protein
MPELGEGLSGYLDVENATLRAPRLEAVSNIGIANTAPRHAFSVGSNLYVSTKSSNVLTVNGNVACEGIKMGLIEITPSYDLAAVSNVGNVTQSTIQFSNATTGFVTTSNVEIGGGTIFSGHILPSADNTYDIGSAAFKIRDMYISDNSLWIGDDTKLSITEGELKFRKRNTEVVPKGITDMGGTGSAALTHAGVSDINDMKLHHWEAYAKSIDATKTTKDIFTDDVENYETSAIKTFNTSNAMTIGTTKTFVVTVSDASGANKYYIDGIQQPYLTLHQHQTYIFDLSSPTLVDHPFVFSETADGSAYTTGITTTGAYGSTEKRTFIVPAGAPATLYYYCTAHAGMGATVSISSEAELIVSGRFESTGTGGTTLGGGTTAQRPTYAPLGTIRYNSTTGFMEGYAAAGWAPIAQPPTVTGISPLTTVRSGGYAAGWSQEAKLQASDIELNDRFGYSVSMSGDGTKVIMGAYYEDTDGTDAGAAYIFAYDGSSWSQEAKIQSSDIAAGHGADDNFGFSVSMNSDGTKVIVGANKEDTGAADAGAAYIFAYDGSSWSQEGTIRASDPEQWDNFGNSVSMSGDGTKVIVGAKWEDTTYANAGSAYIFAYDGSSWSQEGKIRALDPEGNDNFGNDQAVSMNSDGTKVIVGAKWEDTTYANAGSAYIFAYDGSSWAQEAKFQSTDIELYDNFGYSTSMSSDGTKVIVGAPFEDTDGTSAGSAYIFAYDGSSWSQEGKIQSSDVEYNDRFGTSVSMNSDGTKVIVGAHLEDEQVADAGAAYIFAYDGSSWSQEGKIQASDPETTDYFGTSVSMSGDGTKVIAGAYRKYSANPPSTGAAYTFDYKATALFDASTQVFTATGTGIVSGSTVQLEGANGSLYSVVDATEPNAAGTQVTFKMGSEAGGGVEFPPMAMTNNSSITGYVASASPGSTNAYKAFDDVVTTGSFWTATPGNATAGYSTTVPYLAGLDSPATQDISGTTHRGHWIQLQIPNPVVLSRAVIGSTQSGYLHGQFVILGSNDGTNWTSLHAGTGTTLSTNVTTLSAGSTEAFSYFRVVIKSKGAGSIGHNIELNNVQFFGGSGSWVLANQPYKVRINSTSGLIGTSTAAIAFPTVWTTAANANLYFETDASQTRTLVGTDGAGGTNRTFSLAPGSNALPSGLTLTGSTGAITGQIAANQDGVTTSVTFRLTDNGSGLFTDRAINIVGSGSLYAFTSFTFTNAGQTGRTGPSLATLTGHSDYSSAAWRTDTNNFSQVSGKQGFQLWTIPTSGTYRIIAKGAMGGDGDTASKMGGYGGEVQADFAFTKGTKIVIIVGQKGEDSAALNKGGAGGGGTYVLAGGTNFYPSSTNDIYLIAGGGAGGHGYHGTLSRTASANASSNGSSPNGGLAASTTTYEPGGGAGWGGSGAGSSGSYPSGGRNPENAATGGYGGYSSNETSHRRYGGFGGGGGNGAHSSGGGGGYGGGQAQYWGTNTLAAASTSYIQASTLARVSGTAVFSGNHTSENGSVIITKL